MKPRHVCGTCRKAIYLKPYSYLKGYKGNNGEDAELPAVLIGCNKKHRTKSRWKHLHCGSWENGQGREAMRSQIIYSKSIHSEGSGGWMTTWKHNIFPLLGYFSMGSVIAVLIMMAIAYGLWLLLPIPFVLWLYLRLFVDVPWRRARMPSRHDQIEKLLESKREVKTKDSQNGGFSEKSREESH